MSFEGPVADFVREEHSRRVLADLNLGRAIQTTQVSSRLHTTDIFGSETYYLCLVETMGQTFAGVSNLESTGFEKPS